MQGVGVIKLGLPKLVESITVEYKGVFIHKKICIRALGGLSV